MAEIKARRYTLRFEDWPGVEIVVKSVPLGVLLAEGRAALETLEAISAGGENAAVAHSQSLTTVGFQPFVDAVESWNLEVAGQPVPITVDGLLSLPDPTFIQAAIEGWRDAQTRVKESDPLPEPSNGGAPSPGVSIPMEVL